MKRKMLTVLGVVLALLSLVVAAAPAGADGPSERYVIVFEGDGVPDGADRLVEAAGGRLVKILDEVGLGIATSSNPGFAASLSGAKGIASVGVESSYLLPASPILEDQTSGPTPADFLYPQQWNIRRVKADQAWEITTGSHDTVVAVIDTGIAWNHPDLAPNVVYHTCYSVLSPCLDYPSMPGIWGRHGTGVAGIIAAAFGGGGVVGVGPNLGLASYNVYELIANPDEDPGDPNDDYLPVVFAESMWAALLDASARGYEVANISAHNAYLDFSEGGAAMWTAWNRVANLATRRGMTIVASAGNGYSNLNGSLATVSADLPNVISVGATGIRPLPEYPQEGAYDVLADYSNWGASITLVAPGGDLGPESAPIPWLYYYMNASVLTDPVCAATENCPVGYGLFGGTSGASPHVAGVAGLIIDQNPGLNPHQVRAILKQTAEDLGDQQLFGHGMVDAHAAVSK